MPITVSIVEDDSKTREILSRWIAGTEGFKLLGDWGDTQSALEVLPGQKPNVVLMDINLPPVNGTETVRKLKPLLPDTQFVMLTIYQDADHIYEALAAGATGYLLKHMPKEELLNALEDVHNGGSPMTSVIARKVMQAFAPQRTGLPPGVSLSTREQEVLDLLARGYIFAEVAERLKLSKGTVKTYVRRLYEKLHVCSRSQAVAVYAHLATEATPAKALSD